MNIYLHVCLNLNVCMCQVLIGFYICSPCDGIGFPSLFLFLHIFHVKNFFCYMWGCEEDKGDARIPLPPGRVKDGGIVRVGREFGAGGCIVSARLVGGSGQLTIALA